MKIGWLLLALAFATGGFAQRRGAAAPTVTRGFGSVVFPGGTSATSPNITRTFGSVVFPGGTNSPRVTTAPGIVGSPNFPAHPVNPGMVGQPSPNFRRPPANRNVRHMPATSVYAYPVFVGGGYAGGGYYDNGFAQEPPPGAPQQPNVTVVYPQPQVTPVIIHVGSGDGQYTERQPAATYREPVRRPEEEPAAADPSHYLIAFKDHTIYSAVAYWVDGDTLHYFTNGNTHNQASVSLIDRDLTQRLNKESGIDFRLPN
jgi:hypothetical protein